VPTYRAYINQLPNAAFAVVEPCWRTRKDARHLPHHKPSVKNPNENSSIDLPHLRNALARMNQIKAVCPGVSTEAIRARAKRHLIRHAKAVLPSSKFAASELDPENQCKILADAIDEMIKKIENERLEITSTGWKLRI